MKWKMYSVHGPEALFLRVKESFGRASCMQLSTILHPESLTQSDIPRITSSDIVSLSQPFDRPELGVALSVRFDDADRANRCSAMHRVIGVLSLLYLLLPSLAYQSYFRAVSPPRYLPSLALL